jgi:hypothetical protein
MASSSLYFWHLLPKGEKVIGPKQKDRTTTLFSKTFSKSGRDYLKSLQNPS